MPPIEDSSPGSESPMVGLSMYRKSQDLVDLFWRGRGGRGMNRLFKTVTMASGSVQRADLERQNLEPLTAIQIMNLFGSSAERRQ